jgi:hypothetical protein
MILKIYLNNNIVYVIAYDNVYYFSYLIFKLCLCAETMVLYNKDSTTYGVARDVVPLIQDEDYNPLINKHSIYKLSMFQNMQYNTVTVDTDINSYVRECTILAYGTKIYCFSKELLAYIEMCVAFSLYYYRQDDPRTAGAMDTYFWDALQTCTDVT